MFGCNLVRELPNRWCVPTQIIGDIGAGMESKEAWKITGDLHVEHGKGDPFAAAIRATRMPMLIADPRPGPLGILFKNSPVGQRGNVGAAENSGSEQARSCP